MLTTDVNEQLVVDVWERQAFDRRCLNAVGIEVIYRGVPSDAGGPDYQEAILSRRGRTLLTGDVEFHVRSSDWYRHGHHQDSRYNRVILHVVWHDDSEETHRQDGETITTIALASCAAELPRTTARQLQLSPHPCVDVFATLSQGELETAVIDAGLRRFRERADKFAADLTHSSADQVIYTALLEGLGYASNRAAFRLLAEAVPLGWLAGVAPDARLTVLLDAARLGEPGPCPPPARLPPNVWRLSRIRPANHPAKRLAGLCLLLDRLSARPADRLAELVMSAATAAELRRLLMVRSDDVGLLGAGRADELVVSAILPFVAGLEPERPEPLDVYRRYPSPPRNRWTRTMLELFRQADHNYRVQLAPQHQGLHYLYHQHCRSGRRAGCPACGLWQPSLPSHGTQASL